MKRAEGITPRCETERGCPIEGIAKDLDIWRESQRFINARSLKQTNHIDIFLKDFYLDHGFNKDPAAALELEGYFAHWWKVNIKKN